MACAGHVVPLAPLCRHRLTPVPGVLPARSSCTDGGRQDAAPAVTDDSWAQPGGTAGEQVSPPGPGLVPGWFQVVLRGSAVHPLDRSCGPTGPGWWCLPDPVAAVGSGTWRGRAPPAPIHRRTVWSAGAGPTAAGRSHGRPRLTWSCPCSGRRTRLVARRWSGGRSGVPEHLVRRCPDGAARSPMALAALMVGPWWPVRHPGSPAAPMRRCRSSSAPSVGSGRPCLSRSTVTADCQFIDPAMS